MNNTLIKYKLLKKFFPNCVTSELLTSYLKLCGIKVGNGTVIFNAGSVCIDSSRPVLMEIGEYCKITKGVVILGHDYSRSVLRRVYGDIVGEARKTIIGNNVFIGMNSIVLMGSEISDNSIVGAGSVCHGFYPSNSIIAGNPAKVIMSLDEYYKKRKVKYIDEAKNMARLIEARKGRKPTVNEMGAFFPIYLERDLDSLRTNDLNTDLSGDEESEIINSFLSSKPIYASFEEFLKDC